MKKIYVVKYSGPFGFIKPWTAVRDEETYSQQFLTPSIVAGIERKIFPELLKEDDGKIKKIVGHRLRYKQISQQKEVTQTRGMNSVKVKELGRLYTRGSYKNGGVSFTPISRGVLVEPRIYLVFTNIKDAQKAARQHICLCRNEDLLYPEGEVLEVTRKEFDKEDYAGFELVFDKSESSFLVGYNRLANNEPMYGYLKVVGTPVRTNY
ncbi:MAG: hypothetical protein MI975_19040 [Cytophagales bacterium]|nr:hypothetical protein [Cytophagales bacterium]